MTITRKQFSVGIVSHCTVSYDIKDACMKFQSTLQYLLGVFHLPFLNFKRVPAPADQTPPSSPGQLQDMIREQLKLGKLSKSASLIRWGRCHIWKTVPETYYYGSLHTLRFEQLRGEQRNIQKLHMLCHDALLKTNNANHWNERQFGRDYIIVVISRLCESIIATSTRYNLVMYQWQFLTCIDQHLFNCLHQGKTMYELKFVRFKLKSNISQKSEKKFPWTRNG